jgi:CDP-glycerol glycerophosphotransferase (TagB/SpsB family)
MKKNGIGAVNERRKRYWAFNAFLVWLLRLYPFRKSNVWLFGCWEGNRYSDNSRYLFEHVNQHHPEITCVWITKQREIYEDLKKKGYTVCMSHTWEGIKWQLRSGVVFYTNGLDDFSDLCLIGGAKVVALWHGTGMKDVYYAKEKHKNSFRFKLKLFKDRIFSVVYRDISIATSELSKENLANNLLLDRKKIFITGYPRNDIYKKEWKPSQVLKTVENADDYSYILIMPTHRPYESRHIEEMVELLATSEPLQKKLSETNTIILLKLHYLDRTDETLQTKYMRLLEDKDVSSASELQAIADCLITDYSSCITDFSLREKEVILYAPDFQEYKSRCGLNRYWTQLIPQQAINNPDDLLKAIGDSAQRIAAKRGGNSAMLDLNLRDIVHEAYEDESIRGTCYSENVYKLVKMM